MGVATARANADGRAERMLGAERVFDFAIWNSGIVHAMQNAQFLATQTVEIGVTRLQKRELAVKNELGDVGRQKTHVVDELIDRRVHSSNDIEFTRNARMLTKQIGVALLMQLINTRMKTLVIQARALGKRLCLFKRDLPREKQFPHSGFHLHHLRLKLIEFLTGHVASHGD